MDRAVRDLFEAANDWSVSLTGGEHRDVAAAQGTAQDAMQELSGRVLKPLVSALAQEQTVRRLRIAPDGMLTLLPFEALSSGSYLIERCAVSLPFGGARSGSSGSS